MYRNAFSRDLNRRPHQVQALGGCRKGALYVLLLHHGLIGHLDIGSL